MQNYDIIGTLRTYATAKGWAFLSGDKFYQNYEADQHNYINNQNILAAEFSANTVFRNGGITSINYAGILMLGIKFDNDGTPNIIDNPLTPLVDETANFNDGTPANLDELFIQKYDRRLLSLMQLLSNTIIDFACTNELSISNANFTLALNKFDTNIDFAVCNVTFIQ